MMLSFSWRISGDVNRYYQGSLDPARPDADFVGYNNMWLNLTNGHLIGHTVLCFTFIDNRVFRAQTEIVARKPQKPFISVYLMYDTRPKCHTD